MSSMSPLARKPSPVVIDAIDKDLADALDKISTYNKEHNIVIDSNNDNNNKKDSKYSKKNKKNAFGRSSSRRINWVLLELIGPDEEEYESEETRQWRLEYKKEYEENRRKVEEEEKAERLRRDKIAAERLKRFKIYGRY